MSTVGVFATSPASLTEDVARALAHPTLGTLEPERPTWIKVNGNFNVAYPGSNTSLWFLDALLSALSDRGFRTVTVVEGDLPEFRAEHMARDTGLSALLLRHRTPFLSYERLPRDAAELPKALSEVQLINAPVFHTHGQAVISCAAKNLFGLLPWDRRKYHRVLTDKVLELCERVPCATIVDGTVGLEGESTRRGDPVRCDVLMTGTEPLEIDVLAARLMGFDSRDVPLLAAAEERGRLDPARIVVAGDYDRTSLPRHHFRLEIGGVRRVANWVSMAPISMEPLYAVTDVLRVGWHRVNFRRKRRILATGPWMEYADSR